MFIYIIINISCPRKRIKNLGNVMQPLTGPYVYGVNRRSENFLRLSDFFFLREEGALEADINM